MNTLDIFDDAPVNIMWTRDIRFCSCPVDVLGDSSVIKVTTHNNMSSELLDDLEQRGFCIYHTAIQTVESHEMPVFKVPQFSTFETDYAWVCVKSRGYQATDRITSKIVDLLEKNRNKPVLASILLSLSDQLDSNYFCMPEDYIASHISAARGNEDKTDHEENLPPNYTLVRRAVKTPLRIILLREDPIIDNRVVRQYGSDRFIRVAIRDEDFVRLNQTTASGLDIPMKEIEHFITGGMNVSDRQYKFLACSNSQLREHGLWMYAENGSKTVRTIRRWMGDFSHEKCVATYVSRMGQCFSSTKDTVDVSLHDKTVEYVNDIANAHYTFTDGIGKMSIPLAKNVSMLYSYISWKLDFIYVNNLC
jgi:RNA-dependent RNA polymerase